MHRILFVDVTCPSPYDGHTLRTQPQGGSESTLTRVAEALARKGHRVRVTQYNRAERGDFHGVEYTSTHQNLDFDPTHVVAFRKARILTRALRHWPRAKAFAWYQDFPDPGPQFHVEARTLARHGATAVLVSDWHRGLWTDYLRAYGFGAEPTRRIYNSIPDDLRPDGTPVDRDKLVFFSSPHKGLAPTLRFFARLRDHPELGDVRLHVANPGYLDHSLVPPDDRMVDVGPLPWGRVIDEVRSAFLVLHYNKVYPETFGLVHAEADAVGTPWISGNVGANPEVASHPDEIAELDDPDAVIDRIVAWRTRGRPPVRAGEQFRISKIAAEWEDLLDAPPAGGTRPTASAPALIAGASADGEVACSVDRGEVEAGDTSRAAGFFARLTADGDSARAHLGRVDLRFAGYDGDARPVWAIPEVRAWLAALDAQVASWFWYLTPRPASDGLLTVMLALCPHSRPGAGRPDVGLAERGAFLAKHFDRFHAMWRKSGIRGAASVPITQAVARYYASRLPG